MKHKRRYRRGYPVAVLVGLEEAKATLWKVFSNVVKPEKTLGLDGTRSDSKAVYNFHESIINALRPTLSEGVRSIILVAPMRTDYAQELIHHVQRHHAWLVQGPNKATFSEIAGSAGTLPEVTALTKSHIFRRLISKTTSEETENLIDMLERCLNSSNQSTAVLYSLIEIEELILGPQRPATYKPEYIMLTDKYLSDSCEKNRIHRLMQIATNRNVKTRIVDVESTAGMRLTQLGGMVCFARRE